MIKVKDGYAKLVGATASGSASHILLSNGGVKAVSDFALADGTNATGTWSIDISGNAKTATTATTASKLSTVSKTAWGLTYWTSGGVPTSISGDMTGVGNINMTGSINSVLKATTSLGAALLNITEVTADTNYIHLYVSSLNSTAATTRALVLQNGYGNVGIGTTSPLSKLLVEGATIINGPQNALTINSSGKSAYTLFIKMINPNMSTTYHTSLLTFGYDQTAYNIGYIGFKFVAKDSKSNMVTLGLHSVDHVLNITGNGFVGIGTEVPTASLSVNGHVHIGNSSGVLSSPWKSGIVIGPDGTDKIVATYLASSTNGATVGAHNSALSAWAPLHLGGTNIQFRVNESLKMILTTSGQLAILKTGASTNSGLVVGGTSSQSNISTSIADLTAMIQIVAGSGGNTNSTAIGFHNPGISSAALEYRNTDVNTGYFKFRSDDSTWGVGINNTGNPRGLLDVNGDIYTNPYIRFVDSQRYCGYFSGGKYLELHNGVGGVGIHLYDNGNAYVYKSGNPYTIIHSGNIGSQSVNYATSAGNADTVDSLHASDFVRAYGTYGTSYSYDSDWGLSIVTFDPVVSGTYPENNPNITILNLGNNYARRKQLACMYNNNNIYYRRRTDSSWSGWVRLAIAGESYTKGDSDGRYYPISGNVNMSGDNKWIGSTMGGGTDYWRIGGSGTSDNGVCQITIGDNSNDYFQIVIADYTGTNYTALLVKAGGTYAPHFYESSDQRLKTNIQAILNKDNIPQIKEFDWKESGEHSYGLIAQELEELGYPELVSTKDDGYKTVNYSAALSLIVGKLLVKIQEIEKENKELRDEINNLKTNKLWQS